MDISCETSDAKQVVFRLYLMTRASRDTLFFFLLHVEVAELVQCYSYAIVTDVVD